MFQAQPGKRWGCPAGRVLAMKGICSPGFGRPGFVLPAVHVSLAASFHRQPMYKQFFQLRHAPFSIAPDP
ncbi:MAG: hypothetical protein ACJ8G3_14215, partial [Burkholderiaceae bacterium]